MSGIGSSLGLVPAYLSFFAIFNPSLGKGDDSLHEQIVYFFHRERSDGDKDHLAKEQDASSHEENWRLRTIGLVQAMIQFSEGFAQGSSVDCIDTDKSRKVIQKLDGNWWLLAVVNFTCLVKPLGGDSTVSPAGPAKTRLEYSSREVAPAALLSTQLLRAHGIFLLHHGHSLADVWSRTPRIKFCGFLKRFWDKFLSSWDVLLHGNPAVDIYNGLKLSGGGELGIGVGEEDWGSGEREVLEGFIHRTEGLVDLLVARFDSLSRPRKQKQDSESSYVANSSDGVIFSGIGTLTRSSARDVSAWMEWMAEQDSGAYGIQDNPASLRHRERAKEPRGSRHLSTLRRHDPEHLSLSNGPGIPASIVSRQDGNVSENGTVVTGLKGATHLQDESIIQSDENVLTSEVIKYLTLGIYGSNWGLSTGRRKVSKDEAISQSSISEVSNKSNVSRTKFSTSDAYFLVGFLGDLENESGDTSELEAETDHAQHQNSDGRILMRHLHLNIIHTAKPEPSADDSQDDGYQSDLSSPKRLRVVVYVQPPFMFTFLFKAQTDNLALPYFYRSLHHQLGPLRASLMRSTDPGRVAQKIAEGLGGETSRYKHLVLHPVEDLVHDPVRLTIHSTIPSIPAPGVDRGETVASPSRIEILSLQSQILNTYVSTRLQLSELEQTCKTSRGWWVVWMRLPPSRREFSWDQERHREAILVRRGSQPVAPRSRQTSSAFNFSFGRGTARGASNVGEGIGIDARQYIETLLSLSR